MTVVAIWQCIFKSNHHIVHLKYIQFLFVMCILIKLEVGEKLGKSIFLLCKEINKVKKEHVWRSRMKGWHGEMENKRIFDPSAKLFLGWSAKEGFTDLGWG